MTRHMDATNGTDFRRVLSHFASGITVVTGLNVRQSTVDGPSPFGLTCQSFASVSLDPPLVAFFVAKDSHSLSALRESGAFCVNVLAERQLDLARIFAVSGADKFRGVQYVASPSGLPIIDGSIAWIDCAMDSSFDAGDHVGVIGRVRHLGHASNASPLLFFRGDYGTFQP